MSRQPEIGPPVMKLYAIELPDGSIAMSGPYVLATESEGQSGRMAHARDGQEIAFVRELQQSQPRNYDFTGWDKHPLELFDNERWGDCLHATIQALNLLNNPAVTQTACMDTGVLHELAHLASGLPICTHTSMPELRAMLDSMIDGGLQQAQVVGADVARLMELVYVPGAWRCPKCNLRLIASTLSMGDGGMYANNEPQECANGCGSMWRVTEREDRQEAQRFAIEQAEALTTQSSAPVVGDEMVSIPRATLKWWRELVDINPADLAPRIESALTSVNTQQNQSPTPPA